jgi:hypothetical protein
MRLAAGLLVAGIVLFSGSLYLLALVAPKALGMVTPIGGLGVHAGMGRVRDWRHLRQNAGVSTTSKVKSSRRPSSMPKLQIQVCVSLSTA